MAESETLESLRGELGKLSAQVENIVKTLESKKNVDAADLVDKLSREIANLKAGASDRAQQLYSAGKDGVEEMGEHVRQNPLTSILVAFGAGCVISCLLRHLGK